MSASKKNRSNKRKNKKKNVVKVKKENKVAVSDKIKEEANELFEDLFKEELPNNEEPKNNSTIENEKVETVEENTSNEENIFNEENVEIKEEVKEDISEETEKDNTNVRTIEEVNELSKLENEIPKEVKKDEKPEYVKQMLKIKKRKKYAFTSGIVVVLLIIAMSTGFAISNMNNTNMLKGVKIKKTDLSKLSVDEANEKINTVIEKELLPEINLSYKDYKTTLKPEQIEFKYNIENALSEAYDVGRAGNIFQNNYEIILTSLFTKNINIDYTYNENLLNDFIDNANSELPGVVVQPSHYIEEKNLYIDKGKDGISIDKEKLKDIIIKDILERTIEKVTQEGYTDIINIPIKETKAEEINIDKIYAEVHREPQNAYFETDPYKLYVDVDGVDFGISIDEAKNKISSEDKEEYTIPLKFSKADVTIYDLGREAFPYLISTFSTKYDASNVNRSTNLAIAAEKINGKVLMPGEVFSFNTVVGKRTIEDGYKDAKIYADGGVVDGLAGGICQISSTLYNAALLANLEIVERRNHSYPTSYIQVGRDATVVYGTKDFQFKNSRSYPIKIEASVKNGVAEFKIYGIQEAEEYEIKILPVTTGTIPYGTSQIFDASLAPGQQVVTQSGHMGYKVTTYIEKRLNGAVVSKEILSNDTYSPMQTIVRVGPAAAPVVDPNIPQ